MSSASVTEWLENLKDGESQAAQKLWERYLHGLLRPAQEAGASTIWHRG